MASPALTKLSIENTPTKISANGTAAKNRIAQARSLVNAGATGSQARQMLRGDTPKMSTGFTIEMPDTVPSEALNGKYSLGDVRAARDSREQADLAAAQFDSDYTALTGRIGNTTIQSPFTDPEKFLNRLLLRGTTDTQQALDTQRQTQAETIRGFATDYTKTGEQARTDLGIPELQTNLADTRSRIAERQVKLRETLRDFETNAERRGVAREFVEAEKQAVQAQAAEELADLAIIESAQLGNLNEARAEVDTILAEKRQAFEFENAAIETEIARLQAMDTRESEARSEQLQIALDERKRNIETALANEKEQREYMVQAAANGADQGTLAAIRNAKSPQEAAFLASPFIGRLDRLQAEASMAQGWARIGLDREKLLLDRAAAGDKEAARQLGLSTEPDEQEYQIKSADIQMGIGAAQAFLNNAEGIKLATGAFQSPFMAATTQAIGGGTALGAVGGSVVPGLGTVLGGAAGALAGVAATPFFYSRTKTAKDEALAAASFLVNDTTFQEIRDLKASGVTFGNMTEGERIAAGRAAQQLNSAAIVDESGTVSGFRGSPESVKKYVNDILVAYQGRQEYLDRQKTISQDDESEALSVWNQN